MPIDPDKIAVYELLNKLLWRFVFSAVAVLAFIILFVFFIIENDPEIKRMYGLADGGLVVIIVIVVVILSRLGRWQWIWGALKTFVWPFRKMGRALAMARFSQALGLLLGSGIGVKTATERAARTADNPYITASLIQALPRLDRGATLTEALSPCRYLDPRVRETLYVGEQSGTLPVSLAKVAEQLDLEAMAAAHVATRVFEITVILLVLLIGGWFVISFWTGYYNNLFEMLDI